MLFSTSSPVLLHCRLRTRPEPNAYAARTIHRITRGSRARCLTVSRQRSPLPHLPFIDLVQLCDKQFRGLLYPPMMAFVPSPSIAQYADIVKRQY